MSDNIASQKAMFFKREELKDNEILNQNLYIAIVIKDIMIKVQRITNLIK